MSTSAAPMAELIAEAQRADAMFLQAVDAAFESGSCSVTIVQRRLRLGYTRASELVDRMVRVGIVGGPMSGFRITTADWWLLKAQVASATGAPP